MTILLSVIAGFLLGIIAMLYFLHKFAHFDFLPKEKKK